MRWSTGELISAGWFFMFAAVFGLLAVRDWWATR